MHRRGIYGIIGSAFIILILAGCSTAKNTAGSRFYQSMVTRYNVYHNGAEAYKEGYEAQEKAVNDNYLEILDLYPVSDEKVWSVGTTNYDIAIEKAQKGIKLHSITVKPERKPGKTLTEKDKAWQNKNEYNPFLWNAWMLLADAQMQKGEFIEAASTYTYISNLYFDEPAIVAEALMKMAQCYSELGWNYESDELFDRLDTIPTKLKKEYAARKASHLLKQGRYKESIPLLENAIERSGRSKLQRIREQYLLAQLYKSTGRNSQAYKAFQKVLNMNPPYIIEFYARIQQTETMSISNSKQMLRKLHKMERDLNNKEYLDQIYYAIGNIYLTKGDTATAILNYETGLEKSTKSSPEKGILLLTMANLYWDLTDYANAGRCYSQAIGLIDNDHKEYDVVKLRSEVLDELTIYTENIQLQDSLQHLATLPEAELDIIIDRLIEQAKAEEEARLKAAEEAEQSTEQGGRLGSSTNSGNNSDWYFYNTNLVENGKKAFSQQWGNRKLEDNWRRSNKTVLAESYNTATEQTGSDSIPADTTGIAADTMSIAISNDPFSKEYYLQNIPYSEEQLQESNRILTDALLNAGIVYKDRLTEYAMAEESFNRIINSYPDATQAPDAYYQLYLMYSLWDRAADADSCKSRMSRLFPDNPLTITICNPDFIENAKYGKHREDSLYAETYRAYLDEDFDLVKKNCNLSAQKYPLGAHRAKFLFLQASILLQDNDTAGFLSILKDIVSNYPENEISQLAGLIAQGMQDGKLLQTTSFNSIWDIRNTESETIGMPDSLKPQFNAERYQPYIFILAYPADSLNENQLLYEVAKYNFTNFMVRNFEISFTEQQGIGMMKIKEFLNYDEAYFYKQSLYSDSLLAEKLSGIKAFIITEENLELLFKHYSFNEYQEFYEEHFLSIPEFDINGDSLFEEYEENDE